MAKELPKMYQNKITKTVNNRQEVYTTLDNTTEERNVPTKKEKIPNYSRFTIEQKIYKIFSSPDYIYKVDVTIVTDEGSFKKRIVGKNKSHLITMDNEYIEISKIKDIYK